MAFIVKKPVAFLLPILLLLLLACSSHANDDLPHVRQEYRKLLGLGGLIGKGLKNLVKKPNGNNNVIRWPPTNGLPKSTTPPIKNFLSHFDQILLKAAGEKMAEKLFVANGKKGFRVGWKSGKWVYKMDDKCEKFEEALNTTCNTSQLPLANCVISLDFITGSNVIGCSDLEVPIEETIPCTYSYGSISIGTSVYQFNNSACSTSIEIEP